MFIMSRAVSILLLFIKTGEGIWIDKFYWRENEGVYVYRVYSSAIEWGWVDFFAE